LKTVRFVKNTQFLLSSLERLSTAIGVGIISHSLVKSLSLLGVFGVARQVCVNIYVYICVLFAYYSILYISFSQAVKQARIIEKLKKID